jgi:hypothetical protein
VEGEFSKVFFPHQTQFPKNLEKGDEGKKEWVGGREKRKSNFLFFKPSSILFFLQALFFRLPLLFKC